MIPGSYAELRKRPAAREDATGRELGRDFFPGSHRPRVLDRRHDRHGAPHGLIFWCGNISGWQLPEPIGTNKSNNAPWFITGDVPGFAQWDHPERRVLIDVHPRVPGS